MIAPHLWIARRNGASFSNNLMIPRAFGPVITEIPPRDEVLRRRSPFEGFHSSESVQHPAFYRCRESYPRRNGSPRNCCSRAGDRAYGQTFQRRIRAMGIRDRPISPRSPWQNPYAERLIGTLRRGCLDHVLIVGERHLRRMLASYSSYYNESRARTWLWRRMRRYGERSRGAERSSPRQFFPDYTIAMRGYDFREGQGEVLSATSLVTTSYGSAARRVARLVGLRRRIAKTTAMKPVP